MARTTSSAVQALLLPGKDYDTSRSPSLTPFLDTATALVDDVSTYAGANSITVSDARLELIERWLAAHFYKVSDRPRAFAGNDGVQANFDGKTETSLKATLYGQTAVALDPTGVLAGLSSEERADANTDDRSPAFRVAGGFWMGRPPSQQTDYDQRD